MSGAGFWTGYIKCLLATGGGVAKAGRRRSLRFRRDIKARESSGISVEEAFEALRLVRSSWR